MDTQLFTAEPRPSPSADEGKILVSRYDSETSTLPRRFVGAWPDVVETSSTHRRAACTKATCPGHSCANKRGLAYSFAEIRQGGRRRAADVLRVHVLLFDIDDPPRGAEEANALASRLKAAGLACVLSSTHSHRPGAPRLRLVIRLSRPVLLAEWATFWAAARARLEVPADEAAKDPARLFFEPSTPSDVAPFVWVNEGAALDVDQVLRSVPPPAPAARRQPLKGTEWSALLHGLDTGNRNQGLVRLAGFLMHKLDAEGALAADLIRTINNSWCKPPLEGREVETLIESVARRELAQRGAL